MLGIFSYAYWLFISLQRNVYSNFLPILSWIVCIFVLNCKISLYVLDFRPLSDYWYVKFFSHTVGCLFIFLLVSLKAQTVLCFDETSLSMFSLVAYAFAVVAKKSFPNPMPQVFIFYFKSFIVLGFTFKSLIYFV